MTGHDAKLNFRAVVAVALLFGAFALEAATVSTAPAKPRRVLPAVPKTTTVAPTSGKPAAKPAAKPVVKPATPLVFPEISLKNGRKYYDLKKIAVAYGFRTLEGYEDKNRTLTLLTPHNERIVFTVTKQIFQISGTVATLSYPVSFEQEKYLLEKTDYSEFLEPLLRTALLPRREIKHIVLDAGHGGKDQGASSGKTLEKNLNLLMAQKVASILRKRGYVVSMTRNNDTALTLDQRCQTATTKKADLFLSIHCNSAKDTSIHGIEVFLANPPGVPSFGTTNIGKTGAATPYQKTSALWAYFTQRALLKASGAEDRGIKRKQFKVIIDSPAPALLVELGFLSNKAECANLLKPDYQDKLAVALCDAIDKLKRSLKPRQ